MHFSCKCIVLTYVCIFCIFVLVKGLIAYGSALCYGLLCEFREFAYKSLSTAVVNYFTMFVIKTLNLFAKMRKFPITCAYIHTDTHIHVRTKMR